MAGKHFPGGPATEGHCDVGFAFHVQRGNFTGVSLNDLNFVVIAYTPGNMGAGNWTRYPTVQTQIL